MKPVVLTDRHLDAARELRAVLVEEKALATRKSAAKEILAEVLTKPGQEAIDDNGEKWATVRAGAKRFDAEEARRNLPPKALAMILVETPDPTLAKEVLPPALYDMCTKPGAPSIASVSA